MKNSMLKSAGILSLMTILAKVIGFVREMIIASTYGTGKEIDAFFLASGLVTNVLYALTTAVAVAFLPMYIEILKKNGRKKSSQFASKMIWLLSIVSIIVCICVLAFAPPLSRVTAPTYTEEQLSSVAMYLRVLSVGILFSLVTSLMKSILNAEEVYGYGALSGIIYSVSAIGFMLMFQKQLGVLALAISVPVAYFIQYLVLRVRSSKFIKVALNLDFRDQDLYRLLMLSIPILLGNATMEINQFIDRLLASFLTEGAVSALSYSATLSQFVDAIIIGTLVTIYFTDFAQSTTSENMEKMKALIRQGISILCIVVLPISLITMLYGRDIVSIVYGRGAFNEESISITTIGITYYAILFVFSGINALLAKAFYALGNTKTPMWLGVLNVLINITISIFLTKIIGFPGIVLGTVVAEICSTVVMFFFIKKEIGDLGLRIMFPTMAKIGMAMVATGIVLSVIARLTINFSSFIRFIFATTIGVGVYGGILFFLKCDEIMIGINLIKKK